MQRAAPIDPGRPVWRGMLAFLVPLMASNVLQSASSTLSAIYLGRLVGVRALAAVSAFFPVQFFLISFLIGIGSGASVLIGQAWGARDPERVKAVAGTTVTVSLALGVAVGLVGAVATEPILRLIGTPADVLGETVAYSRVIFVVLPVIFTYLTYSTFLRGVGDSRTPFVALLGSTALSVALAPPLIVGWTIFPRLGVVGPAVAGAISAAAALIGLAIYLLATDHPLAPDRAFLRRLRVDWPLLRTLVRIGIPTGIQLVLVSLSEIAVIAFVNRFGSSATAAYGAVNQIASYVQFPAVSIGIAASIFGSQAIGAGRTERLGAIVRAGVTLNYVVEGVLIALGYLFATPLLRLFVTDPAVVATAHELLAITLWSYAIFGNNSILSGLMRASGDVVWPTVNAVAGIWLVEVPVAWQLSRGPLGLRGVWIAYPAAYLAILALQFGYYRFVWKRKPIVALTGPRTAASAAPPTTT